MDIRAADRAPSLLTAEDVFVIPGLDALYDSSGARIEHTKRSYVPDDVAGADHTRTRVEASYGRHCPPQLELPDAYDIIDKTVLYVGHSWNHYGHFLVDVMSRLWALEAVDDQTPLLFLNRAAADYGSSSYSRLVSRALRMDDRLFSPAKPTLIRKIVLPEPAIQHAYRVYRQLALPHVRTAQAVMRGPSLEDRRGRFYYLTRSGLSNDLPAVAAGDPGGGGGCEARLRGGEA